MKRRTKIIITASVLVAGVAALGTAVVAHDKARGYGAMYHSGMGMGPGMGKHGGGYGRHFQKMEKMFEFHDLNKDGGVTQSEMDESRAGRLKGYDQDNDGNLSLKEFEGLWMNAKRDHMVDRFQAFDSDGDAVVTKEEFLSPMTGMIARHDQNGDGKVMLDEMRNHRPWHGYKKRFFNDDDSEKDKD